MKIWFCEDIEDPEQSGFGKSKNDAERYVSGNRGYDYYTGEDFCQCALDGWAKPAIQIDVPDAVALVCLANCSI